MKFQHWILIPIRFFAAELYDWTTEDLMLMRKIHFYSMLFLMVTSAGFLIRAVLAQDTLSVLSTRQQVVMSKLEQEELLSQKHDISIEILKSRVSEIDKNLAILVESQKNMGKTIDRQNDILSGFGVIFLGWFATYVFRIKMAGAAK